MKKKWLVVILATVLICALAAITWANEPIKLVVDGQEIKPDVAPQIIGDRTMVPVRWIAEALGAEVEWDAASRTVIIRTKANNIDSDPAAVSKLIEDFGKTLKNVSLLAPGDAAAESIKENYADYVSPALLAQWQSDPANAPGRVTSSPWPERIEIIDTEKLSDAKYQVKGEIIEVTSVEMANGGYAAKRPISLVVEKVDQNRLITAVKLDAYGEAAPVVYQNSQYGFSLQLPESWQGYAIISDQWKGWAPDTSGDVPVETGALLSIRHPQWTLEDTRQDIPIMVFTMPQWNALQQGEFSVGSAPVAPKELGRNSQYVFALPGEEKEEYILMLPFTPKNRPNMVAWMCARMDGENYGKMLIYNFPKQETIYGPQQIESRIDQDTYISQQLSLWSQQGSSVYRGNLLVIPMSNSILYIEPLYLQASNSKLPELKRVIAGFGNRVVMEPTLEEALTQLFGKGTTKPPATPGDDQEPGAPQETADTIQDLARQARQYYDQANERLREGDWAGYGQSINRLNEIIKRMEAAVSQL